MVGKPPHPRTTLWCILDCYFSRHLPRKFLSFSSEMVAVWCILGCYFWRPLPRNFLISLRKWFTLVFLNVISRAFSPENFKFLKRKWCSLVHSWVLFLALSPQKILSF